MYLFDVVDQKDKAMAVEKLIEKSTPSHSFYIMIILATAMATFGLLLDNSAIVIGSMLISPLLLSLLGIAMGLSMSDTKLIVRSTYTFLWSTLLGIFVALVVTLLFSSIDRSLNGEIISRTFSGLPFMAVAFVAGFAGAFSLVSSKLNESFPGIAISVALLPPIATIGIGFGLLNFGVIRGAFILLLTNIIGILTASLIVFSAMNFHSKKKFADNKINLEEKALKKVKKISAASSPLNIKKPK
jgi:uncharacterized hydrophobic protein (TIGR00271 family)